MCEIGDSRILPSAWSECAGLLQIEEMYVPNFCVALGTR